MANTPVGRFWLLMPWAILALGIPLLLWWYLEPVPVTVTYVAPAFLTQPVGSREEAARYYTYEATGGQTLWRWVEACVSKPINDGASHRSWVGSALVWHAPDLPLFMAGKEGCWAGSVAVEVPTSSPARKFSFRQWITVQTNPFRLDRIEFDPLPLLIRDSKG